MHLQCEHAHDASCTARTLLGTPLVGDAPQLRMVGLGG